MAKKAEVKIYNNLSDDGSWKLEKELNYSTMWDMAYGENFQQKADIFKTDGLVDYEIMGEQHLSYNQVVSITELSNILSEFYDVCAAAIVKHAAPCGVALASNIEEAYNNAFDCDPIASFFGAMGFTQEVNYELAKHLNSMSVKLILAPSFSQEALDLLKDNQSIRVIKINTPFKDYKKFIQKNIKITPFGILCEDANNSVLDKNSFNVVTNKKPTAEQVEDAVFAWKVSKYSRSNSIVIAKDFKTVAIAQGFVSPVNAVEVALNTACDNAKDAILVSDNTLPTPDCIYAAAQSRISTIIQPGGAANEEKLIELADKYNISMIITGIRNYKH